MSVLVLTDAAARIVEAAEADGDGYSLSDYAAVVRLAEFGDESAETRALVARVRRGSGGPYEPAAADAARVGAWRVLGARGALRSARFDPLAARVVRE